MTLLVGQNNNSGFTGGRSLATNNMAVGTLYTAVATGVATSINVWLTPQGGLERFRLGIWNGTTGAPIALSAELSSSSGSDFWATAAISASIASSTLYLLGIFGSGAAATNPIFYYDNPIDSNLGGLQDTGQTYPTQSTFGTNVVGQVGKLPIYLDGTSGVNAAVLTANYFRRRRLM